MQLHGYHKSERHHVHAAAMAEPVTLIHRQSAVTAHANKVASTSSWTKRGDGGR